MSAEEAARKLQEKFGHGSPPTREDVKGYLGEALAKVRPGRKRKAEKMAQLNLRVPEELKHRVRILEAPHFGDGFFVIHHDGFAAAGAGRSIFDRHTQRRGD